MIIHCKYKAWATLQSFKPTSTDLLYRGYRDGINYKTSEAYMCGRCALGSTISTNLMIGDIFSVQPDCISRRQKLAALSLVIILCYREVLVGSLFRRWELSRQHRHENFSLSQRSGSDSRNDSNAFQIETVVSDGEK